MHKKIILISTLLFSNVVFAVSDVGNIEFLSGQATVEKNGKNLTNTEILASKAMVVRNVLEKVLKQMKEEI